MSDASSGYILDVPYTPQFHREHSPVWLDSVLAALGRSRSRSGGTQWCELGCGPGFGLVVLAATNPSITFHGIDINPDHIVQARALADAAGIANVEFHHGDLGSFDDLPAFDHIVVRGIYSWVSPETRQAIRAFLGRWLDPEGVALLHYLTLPGSADFMAMHGLFRTLYRQPGMTPHAAVSAGREILQRLQAGEAGYFAAHPAAEPTAARFAEYDLDYIAHDYLNEHYAPMHVADTITDMRVEGLEFIGSAEPQDNLDDFSVPGNLRALFGEQKSAVMRETIRDMVGNQVARLDLYRHQTRPLTAQEHFAALRTLRFRALPDLPVKGGVIFETRIGKIEGPAEVFAPIIEHFEKGEPVSYAQIEATPAFRSNPGLVNQALHAMMGAGAIHPVPQAAPDPEPARRLNAVLLERHRAGKAVPALAVPALGSGLPLRREALDALAQGREPAAEIRRLLP